MPYTTTFVDDGKGMLKTGSGIVTGLEIFSSALQGGSLDEASARKLRYGLIDFSETTEMNVIPDDIRRIIEMNRKLAAYTPGALVAIVAPTPLPYALARIWHTFSNDLGWKAHIFHARPDAISWLRKEFLARDSSGALLEQFPSLKEER